MSEFFRNILQGLYTFSGNYGLAIILFTILVRLVLSPFDYKSRKSMRQMEKINPKIQALQKKYANDKEKLQRKQAELYKKEHINPLGSCLPVLLTFPILIIMFNAMRAVANEHLVRLVQELYTAVGDLTDAAEIAAALPTVEALREMRLIEPFLWIKNIWVHDSPFTSFLPTSSSALMAIKSISGVATGEEIEALKAFMDGDIYKNIVLTHYNATTIPGGVVNFLIVQLQLYHQPNGYFILPVLSGASQYLMTIVNPAATGAQQTGEGQQNGTGAFMKWFFPLFSIYICATSNSAFSLYWVVANLASMLQTFIFNRYFAAQDKKKAAQSDPEEV